MVGKKNPDVERCLQMALKGVDAEAAWKRCGCPGTLANLKRHIKAAAPSTAGGAAEPSAPSAGKRRRSTPAETPHQRQQSTSAASASAATRKRKEQPHGEVLSGRTGAPIGKKIRKTSLQLETEVQNKALFYQEYKAAHKAATREYAAYVAKGVHRRKGCTASDVAAKYHSTLSQDSKHSITDRALTNWLAHGKAPGSSPQLPGPKCSKFKRALIDTVQSYARMQQVAVGKSARGRELLNKAAAALKGTDHEVILDSAGKRRRLLKALRTIGDPLNITGKDSLASDVANIPEVWRPLTMAVRVAAPSEVSA